MKALYHQPGGSIQLDVIGKPKDGKADLGRDKVVLVGGVVISDSAVHGTCQLQDDADPKAEQKAATTALRKKATALAKTAVDARKAADAAKGKPNEADLVKAAEEADAAAQQADTEADAAEPALKE